MSVKKAGRALRWMAIQALFAGSMYLWLFEENALAGNFFKFWFWFLIVISFILLFAQDVQKEIRKKGYSVPRVVDLCYDVAIVGVLATLGHFVMAGFYMFHLMVYHGVMNKEEKPCDAQPQSQQ